MKVVLAAMKVRWVGGDQGGVHSNELHKGLLSLVTSSRLSLIFILEDLVRGGGGGYLQRQNALCSECIFGPD